MNDLFQHIQNILSATYPDDEARALTYWIFEEAGFSRFDILTCKDKQNIPNLEIIIKRLQKKEPIQYIYGHTYWLGLDIKVSRDTLIPRPETAELVNWIKRDLSDKKGIIAHDLCSGSGCIALALKQAHVDWTVRGYDISSRALEIAKENAMRNNIDIEFCKKDILIEDIESADLIVCNPPYIERSEWEKLDEQVRLWEPESALAVPDNDPLLFYKRIIEAKAAKRVYFEINEKYGRQVADLFDFNGYNDIEIKTDIYGKHRMVGARIKE